MELQHQTALVTGANRGIGERLVLELLNRDVKKVYAAARNAKSVAIDDPRVIPVPLDIEEKDQIHNAVQVADDLTLLINNAGVLGRGGILDADRDTMAWEFNVNFWGVVDMVRAFYPTLERNGGGAIANLLSICSFAGMPGLAGYCASKAAMHSATQSMRADLKDKNISVHGVFPGPIATDMNDGLDIEMATPEATASAILDGICDGAEDIFPDPVGQQTKIDYKADWKALEKQFSQY